jgi:hypothetical protein
MNSIIIPSKRRPATFLKPDDFLVIVKGIKVNEKFSQKPQLPMKILKITAFTSILILQSAKECLSGQVKYYAK